MQLVNALMDRFRKTLKTVQHGSWQQQALLDQGMSEHMKQAACDSANVKSQSCPAGFITSTLHL